MLRRITDTTDDLLQREVPLLPGLLAQARAPTGTGLPSLSIGRHPTNMIVLQSTGIPLLLSRHHAVVTYDGEQITLIDKSTTNGTYVRVHGGGARLRPRSSLTRARSAR